MPMKAVVLLRQAGRNLHSTALNEIACRSVGLYFFCVLMKLGLATCSVCSRSFSHSRCSSDLFSLGDGHFDAVVNDIEKILFDLHGEQLLEDQVFQKFDAEFYRWTRDHTQSSDRVVQLVAELSEVNGKILVASDFKS